MAPHNTLTSLVLATEYAEYREGMHQESCRQFRAGLDCLACDQYQTAWLAADRRLQDFLDAASVLEASVVMDDDGLYGNVSAF